MYYYIIRELFKYPYATNDHIPKRLFLPVPFRWEQRYVVVITSFDGMEFEIEKATALFFALFCNDKEPAQHLFKQQAVNRIAPYYQGGIQRKQYIKFFV